MRKILKDLRKVLCHVHGLEVSILLRWQFSKLIYKFDRMSIKISAIITVEIDKLILNFMWNCK